MNWIKIVFAGIVAWIIPFILNILIFPEIPLGFQFILYLLIACFVLIEYSNTIMSGYLHKRNKITVGLGFAIGITWFLISFLATAVYFIMYRKDTLFDYSMNYGSIYLIYPILGVTIGFCEEKRGRRR